MGETDKDRGMGERGRQGVGETDRDRQTNRQTGTEGWEREEERGRERGGETDRDRGMEERGREGRVIVERQTETEGWERGKERGRQTETDRQTETEGWERERKRRGGRESKTDLKGKSGPDVSCPCHKLHPLCQGKGQRSHRASNTGTGLLLVGLYWFQIYEVLLCSKYGAIPTIISGVTAF